MIQVPRIVQFFVTLTVLYSLFSPGLDQMLPLFMNTDSRYKTLPETFSKLIKSSITRSIPEAVESYMTTPQIIASRGYPVEIHHVVTDDGYVLELHRIPNGKNSKWMNNKTVKKRAIFLQHGMFATDHFFICCSTNNSLAFILADIGYDVWLGNSRGNIYSRKHVRLDPDKDREFWNYSWDEMGRYDIPASINYVLTATNETKLAAYYGYSLGCSLFFIGASVYPELNDRIEIMIGLGPTASFAHLGNYFKYAAPFVKWYQAYQRWFGIGEVHAMNGLLNSAAHLLYRTSKLGSKIGRFWVFEIFGYSNVFYEADFQRLLGHYPAGGSANTMTQLLQNYNSGDSFLHFDHDVDGNMERYGTQNPPEYNLAKVTVPVYLVHSDNDPFAPPQDVSWLISQLGNLKGAMRVDDPTFTHGDFIWSPRLAELVYYPTIKLLPLPVAGKVIIDHE